MGFTLVSIEDSEEFNINFFEWRPLLLLGEAYGWKPAGTLLENDESWDGSYLSNDGQKITQEDCEKFPSIIYVSSNLFVFPLSIYLDQARLSARAPYLFLLSFGLISLMLPMFASSWLINATRFLRR